MRSLALATLAAACHSSSPAPQPPPPSAPSPTVPLTGTWRGTSTCVVKPSACNDERVVYHVAAAGDAYTVVADKLVDGVEQDMGTITCRLAGARLTCPIEKGVFTFTIDGAHIHGTLDLTDRTRFREIDVTRD